MLSLEEYEAGLQSLAEANARQRDRIEMLERSLKEKEAVLEEMEASGGRKGEEMVILEKMVKEEKTGREALEKEIYDLKKSFEHQSDTTERERNGYKSTIETLRESLEREQERGLKWEDDLMDCRSETDNVSLELKNANVLIASMQVKMFKHESEQKEMKEVMLMKEKKIEELHVMCTERGEESERRQARIVEIERAHEDNTHHMTKTRSLASEVGAMRDEISLRESDVKKLERMNEDVR
jgi:chromosome segregation ATPase